jgi:hypothetical protein
MIIGVEMPNRHMNGRDYEAFRVGGFDAAKLRDYHSATDVVELMARGARRFMMRMPASWDMGREVEDGKWFADCVRTVETFAPLGVKDFIVDNEPNIWWPAGGAVAWRKKVERMITVLSDFVPVEQIRLGATPFAWRPGAYAGVEQEWVPEQLKMLDLFQFLTVHSYWERFSTFNHPPTGGNVTEWHDKLMLGIEKPYVIAEWGSTAFMRGLSSRQVERIQYDQYPAWLEWVQTKPYVEATYLFMLGGNEHWTGHYPSDRVLRRIGSIIDRREIGV